MQLVQNPSFHVLRFTVESAHCGGCHTMVRARPIPGYVYESGEDGINTPITNGEEVGPKY